jgi:hypothetical protein
MSKNTNRRVNTLGELAAQYGFSLRVLNDLIDMYPDLKEKVKPFRDGKKIIYPPKLIEQIATTIGEP